MKTVKNWSLFYQVITHLCAVTFHPTNITRTSINAKITNENLVTTLATQQQSLPKTVTTPVITTTVFELSADSIQYLCVI